MYLNIFDPRKGQDFTSASELETIWSSNKEGVLVLNCEIELLNLNSIFIQEITTSFNSDYLGLYVNWLKYKKKQKNEIQACLNSENLSKDNYWGLFPNKEEYIQEIIDCYSAQRTFEHWIVTGFKKENKQDIQNMSFKRYWEIDEFIDNRINFDFIMWFDLDDGWWYLFASNKNYFDVIIEKVSRSVFRV